MTTKRVASCADTCCASRRPSLPSPQARAPPRAAPSAEQHERALDELGLRREQLALGLRCAKEFRAIDLGHFAPLPGARRPLEREGVAAQSCRVAVALE